MSGICTIGVYGFSANSFLAGCGTPTSGSCSTCASGAACAAGSTLGQRGPPPGRPRRCGHRVPAREGARPHHGDARAPVRGGRPRGCRQALADRARARLRRALRTRDPRPRRRGGGRRRATAGCAALMCVERDAEACHRSLIAAVWRPSTAPAPSSAAGVPGGRAGAITSASAPSWTAMTTPVGESSVSRRRPPNRTVPPKKATSTQRTVVWFKPGRRP